MSCRHCRFCVIHFFIVKTEMSDNDSFMDFPHFRLKSVQGNYVHVGTSPKYGRGLINFLRDDLTSNDTA